MQGTHYPAQPRVLLFGGQGFLISVSERGGLCDMGARAFAMKAGLGIHVALSRCRDTSGWQAHASSTVREAKAITAHR